MGDEGMILVDVNDKERLDVGKYLKHRQGRRADAKK